MQVYVFVRMKNSFLKSLICKINCNILSFMPTSHAFSETERHFVYCGICHLLSIHLSVSWNIYMFIDKGLSHTLQWILKIGIANTHWVLMHNE